VGIIETQVHTVCSPFGCTPGSLVPDEDLAHQERADGYEVRAILKPGVVMPL
jgi:hypothetical protein